MFHGYGTFAGASLVLAANANLGDAASANYFVGTARRMLQIQQQLQRVPQRQVLVTISSTNPNITSVGTLSSLSVTFGRSGWSITR
jgi:hypothetical protein